MADTTPAQYTNVTAYVTVKGRSGRPVVDAKVTFTWKFKTVTHVMTAYTGLDGTAAVTRNISGATPGYKVVIAVSATSGGATVMSSTYFTPK